MEKEKEKSPKHPDILTENHKNQRGHTRKKKSKTQENQRKEKRKLNGKKNK